MGRWVGVLCGLAVALGLGGIERLWAAQPAAGPTFEADIAPLLTKHCGKCHAGDEPAGNLRVAQRRDLLAGGNSGPALRLAAAESSLLWEKLAANEMPKEGPPLSAEQKGLLRTWINNGAPLTDPASEPEEVRPEERTRRGDPGDHWAFRPPVRPPVPAVRNAGWVANPIDAFLLAELERAELQPAPMAGRSVLLRRLAFDLVGLPPTPAEVTEWASGDHPPGERGSDTAHPTDEEWDRLVDRWLADPRYGERWGRHWLDLAGYADSAGVLSEDRPLPTAFRFRDYVIRAFNENKPFDRFLQEQLAGDELTGYWQAYQAQPTLPDEVIEGVIATGFLRCAPDSSRPDFSTIKNADALYFYPTLNDTLQIVASATLGLTVQCARCHSHKYDPIPQTDYYRLQAVFMSAFRPRQWIPQMERRLLVATAAQKAEADRHNGELDKQIAQANQAFATIQADYRERLYNDRLAAVPVVIRDDVRQALAKEPAARSDVDKFLVTKFGATLRPEEAQLPKLLAETYAEFRTQQSAHQQLVAGYERQRRHFDELRALYDLPGPVTTPVLRRGDPLNPGQGVEPGVPTALAAPTPFDWQAPPEGAPTSGRRLAFARWLTQPGHPLTARVFVNRLWLHHFGEGLVNTPEDFGTVGSAPSHPALLDWLACEFVESGWNIKHLQRLMLTSQAWRQRAVADPAVGEHAAQRDPDNRLLWRQRIRRLEAEPVRDALLLVAGQLEQRLFGPPIALARHPDGEVTTADPNLDRRRSVYLQVLRSHPLTLLHAFDQPVMETNCLKRSRSTVSTQALTLLNSQQAVRLAESFAQRLLGEAGDDVMGVAIARAYGRLPTAEERAELEQFWREQQARLEGAGVASPKAREQALADLCHMLLSANEFVYID